MSSPINKKKKPAPILRSIQAPSYEMDLKLDFKEKEDMRCIYNDSGARNVPGLCGTVPGALVIVTQ